MAITPQALYAAKALLAAAGLLVLWRLHRAWGTARQRRWDRSLGALAVLSFLSWFNFGLFHLPHFAHLWDVYHYYFGAKYAPELGYTRLYECTAVADVLLGYRPDVEGRPMRDLASNELGTSAAILADPSRCTRHFTRQRWGDFVKDVRFFRGLTTRERWNASQQDHGFNPTPAWVLLARPFTAAAPASLAQLRILLALDPLWIALLWGAAAWGFGWRGAAAALLFWGNNVPADFGWLGGALLRYDWIGWAVLGVAFLKKGKPALAGVTLTLATSLRIFPGLLVLGVVLKALGSMVQERRLWLAPEHRRFAAGCLATLALVVPLSSLNGGLVRWTEFARNSRKHLGTPSYNNMGLATLLSYVPEPVEMAVRSGEDAGDVWWRPHAEVQRQRAPLRAAMVLGMLALTALACAGAEDWVAAILGMALIPFLTTLSCYYYVCFLMLGFLFAADRRLALLAPAAALGTCLAAFAGRWGYEVYVLGSAVAVLTALAVPVLLRTWGVRVKASDLPAS